MLLSALYFFILCFSNPASAQQVTWGLSIGGSQLDYAEQSYTDPSGNIYVCGEFRGNGVDLDPGPGTALLNSNGGCDGFLAEYNSNGQFIQSLRIGGPDLDKINSVTTDASGNIYITGYFRGANVDFDPSPTATAFLTSNGEQGQDNGFGGDTFIAKYTKTGQYLWAFNIGGTALRDNGLMIKLDAAGNIFVSGYFQGAAVDFDPGPGTYALNSANGTAFIAKFSSAGAVIWAINVGAADTDNVIYDFQIDGSGNVIICGFFQGTQIDFDPSPTATAYLDCNGAYDLFVAKYDLAGHYLWAFNIGSTQNDVVRGMVLDAAGNIYVFGDFTGTVDFDPGAATHNLTSNGSSDIFLARFTPGGQYTWAFGAGSGNPEFGWRITTDNSSLFVTGTLYGTADFDPGPATDNLTSHGGSDIFMAKYDLSGNYECGFNIGSALDDIGFSVTIAGPDRFYLVGSFQGVNTDFAPGAPVFPLSSNGDQDGFLVKYYWPHPALAAGSVTGNSFCRSSGTGQLTFTATAGTSPFTLTYTDGTNVYTQTNVYSGVPFNLQVQPSATTTYQVTILQDAIRCSPAVNPPAMTATVTLLSAPLLTVQPFLPVCHGIPVQLNAGGAASYSWTPATGLSDPLIADPVAVLNNTVTYTLTGTGANGCSSSIPVTVNVYAPPVVQKIKDTLICRNAGVQLFLYGAQGYAWTPSATLSDPLIADPVATPAVDTKYYVVYTDTHLCTYLDSVMVTLRPAAAFSVSADATICRNGSVQLHATGGGQYNWQPSAGLDQTNVASPLASPAVTTTYVVHITDPVCAETKDLSVTVKVNPLPLIGAIKSNDLDCSYDKSQLHVLGAASYVWSPATGLNDPRSANPVARPTVSTLYTVTGTDANGCSNTDTITVNVLTTGTGLYLMPNAFTPNNDGKNDCFHVSYWGTVKTLEFSIYNRWGNRVFYTRDPAACWDGTYKGLPQDAGTYIYMIRASTNCQPSLFRKGTFVLIR